MQVTRRTSAGLAALGLGLGLTALTGTGTALAAPAAPGTAAIARGCAPNEGYSFSKKSPYFVTNPNQHPKTQTNGPSGLKLTLTISKGRTVHGEVSGEGAFNLAKLIKSADTKVSGKIAVTETQTVTQSAEWRVPKKDPHGWLAWGSWGYKFNWKLARVDRGCKVEVIAHGTAKLPAKDPGFDVGKGLAPSETKA